MTDANVVFLIDDDDSVRRALARLLRVAGYQVTTFASARDFLERADCQRAACLVLDIRMPGQSGLDIYESLVNGGYRIPTVFTTGHADSPAALRAVKLGAVDFLPKVLDEERLFSAVRAAVAQRPATEAS